MATRKRPINEDITEYRRRRQEAGVGNYQNPAQRYEQAKKNVAKREQAAQRKSPQPPGGVMRAVEHAVGHVERAVAPRKFAQKAQAKRSQALQNAYLTKYGARAATPRKEVSGQTGPVDKRSKAMWKAGQTSLPDYAKKKAPRKKR